MKLLTKANEAKIPPLNTHEKSKPEDVPIAVKFFDPVGSWTWYVTEGKKEEDGDWLFFGLVKGFESELGYFRLSDLEHAKDGIPGLRGLPIERDRHFSGTLADVMAGTGI